MPIYMKVDGLEGDVSAKGHEKWVALYSLDFSVVRRLNTQPGRIIDREGSRPAISEITVSKLMDKSTPLLFSETCVGKAKETVKINLVTTGSTLAPYMEYTLSNVLFSSYKVSKQVRQHAETEHHIGHLYPVETLTLSFDKIETRFTPFNDKHKPESPIPAAYDLKSAQAV